MRCGRSKLTAVDALFWSIIHATDEFFIIDPNERPRHDLVLSLPFGLPTVFSGWSREITHTTVFFPDGCAAGYY